MGDYLSNSMAAGHFDVRVWSSNPMAALSFYYNRALKEVPILVAVVVPAICYFANRSVVSVAIVLNMVAEHADRMDTFRRRSMNPTVVVVVPHPWASSEALRLEVWLLDFYLLTLL